jgi:hypothetical protein
MRDTRRDTMTPLAATRADGMARLADLRSDGPALAQRIAGDLQSGRLRPVTSVPICETEAALRKVAAIAIADACQRAMTREENRLRLRATLFALRQLQRSGDARDLRSAESLAAFVRASWGVEVWRGDPNCVLGGLPPDEHCVEIAVRRVTR